MRSHSHIFEATRIYSGNKHELGLKSPNFIRGHLYIFDKKKLVLPVEPNGS